MNLADLVQISTLELTLNVGDHLDGSTSSNTRQNMEMMFWMKSCGYRVEVRFLIMESIKYNRGNFCVAVTCKQKAEQDMQFRGSQAWVLVVNNQTHVNQSSETNNNTSSKTDFFTFFIKTIKGNRSLKRLN